MACSPGFMLRSNHSSEWFPESGSSSWDRYRGTRALPAAALPVYQHSVPGSGQGSHSQAWTIQRSILPARAPGESEGIWLLCFMESSSVLCSSPGLFYHKSSSGLNTPQTAITCASPHVFIWRDAGPRHCHLETPQCRL